VQSETGRGVLAVDVGSAVSTLSAFINGDVDTTIRTDIGLGHSAHNLFRAAGLDAIERWLPFPISADEIDTYTRNKALHPETIPETLREMYIEHALLRIGIQLLVETSRPMWYNTAQVPLNAPLPAFDPIIGAGAGLTRTGSPGFTALLMLDSLQPEGVTNLQIDPHGLIPVLGALASVKPEAVVQVLDSTSLESLGTSFSLSGQPRTGRAALKVKIKTTNGESIDQQVEGGHVWIYPLDNGESAEVEVRTLSRGTSIGGKGRIKVKLEGGTAGLIFDARGRPLPLAKDPRGRADQLLLWVSQATGDPVKAVDESWFAPPIKTEKEAKPEAEKQKEAKQPKSEKKQPPKAEKKSRFGRRGKEEAKPEADDDQEVNELDDLRNVLS
jgi:MutL-like protein